MALDLRLLVILQALGTFSSPAPTPLLVHSGRAGGVATASEARSETSPFSETLAAPLQWFTVTAEWGSSVPHPFRLESPRLWENVLLTLCL